MESPKSLSLPWKTRVTLWFLQTLMHLITRTNGTVNRRLLKLLLIRTPPSSQPINGVKSHDVVVDPTRNLWFRVYVPTNHAVKDLPVMVFFHGGGFIFSSPDVKQFDDVCRRFAGELPAVVISVDYRLAPEHRHPAQHDDALDVLKFLDVEDNRSRWLPENADISRCFIAGDSAGAHITHFVFQRASQFNFQQLQVIGLVMIQPFFGGEERTYSELRLNGLAPILSLRLTDWFWNAFMPLGDQPYNRDHPLINVSGPNATDISKMDFPPTMVVAGGFDVLHDWQVRYYDWLKKFGKEACLVDYPNMFHGFYVFPELSESDQLISEISDFVQKVSNMTIKSM